MLKDVVVNLSGRAPLDFAADYAISIAATFGAHVTGIAFLYEPVIPDGTLGGVPVDLIELQREENSKIARTPSAGSRPAAKKSGVAAETRLLDATFGGAATLFAQIARRFDISVVGQAQREQGATDELIIEGALFESGRPVIVVPYIQKQRPHARARARLLGRRTHGRARHRRRHAVPHARQGGRPRDRRGGTARTTRSPASSMSEHLARHGVAVEVKRIAKGDIAVAGRHPRPTPPTAARTSW